VSSAQAQTPTRIQPAILECYGGAAVIPSMSKAGRPLGVSRLLRRSPALAAGVASEVSARCPAAGRTAMSVSLELLARNQALFREVNERLLELAEGFPDCSMQFVCECSNQECTQTVNMNPEEYESVRGRSTFFVVASDYDDIHRDRDQYAVLHDHQVVDGETIVEQRALFDIFTKEPLAN